MGKCANKVGFFFLQGVSILFSFFFLYYNWLKGLQFCVALLIYQLIFLSADVKQDRNACTHHFSLRG